MAFADTQDVILKVCADGAYKVQLATQSRLCTQQLIAYPTSPFAWRPSHPRSAASSSARRPQYS